MKWILECISWRSQLTSGEEIADRTTQPGVQDSETATVQYFFLYIFISIK